MMAFVVVGMIILRGVTNFVSTYCLAWVSGKVVMIMRRRLFKHFNVYASVASLIVIQQVNCFLVLPTIQK